MWPKWADKIRLKMAKPAQLFYSKLWMLYRVPRSSWKRKPLPQPASKLSYLGEWSESRENARASGPSFERSRKAHFACPNRRACSQATTSSSFTLKGQWWYLLTKQEVQISTDLAAVVVFATTFNQRLSKCLPGFLLFLSQLLTINSSQWKSITFRLSLFVCSWENHCISLAIPSDLASSHASRFVASQLESFQLILLFL